MGFRRPLARRPVANLLGMAARTAVVAGTASAVTGAVRRHNRREEPVQQQFPVQQQEAPRQTGITEEQIGRLERLAELRKAGVLSEEEFAAQKASILRASA